jgi:hypothetical protein
MIWRVEYSDTWPSPKRQATVTNLGPGHWKVELVNWDGITGRTDGTAHRRVVVKRTLTAAQGAARTFVAGGGIRAKSGGSGRTW